MTGIRGLDRRRLRAFTTSVLVVRRRAPLAAYTIHRPEHPMLDVILVAAALGFFALSVGYTIACDRF
jgi:hypothetical protein